MNRVMYHLEKSADLVVIVIYTELTLPYSAEKAFGGMDVSLDSVGVGCQTQDARTNITDDAYTLGDMNIFNPALSIGAGVH